MHKKIIIIGRTCSGKDSFAKYLCEKLHLQKCLSYTTRPQRLDEVNGVDYNFVSHEAMFNMCRKTNFILSDYIGQYRYCINSEDFCKNDVVILTPSGVEKLFKIPTYKRENFNFIYLKTTREKTILRAKKRGWTLDILNNRIKSEHKQFLKFEQSKLWDSIIHT